MIYVVEEMLDLLFWKRNRILDREGVSVLQWAFMQRASEWQGGVRFSAIIKSTGESKDNVRRAAESLQKRGVGTVTPDPRDHRARIFKLTPRGKRRVSAVHEAFEKRILASVGAREDISNRARAFAGHLWNATVLLESGDLANKFLEAQREWNRASMLDDSLQLVPLDGMKKSVWAEEDRSDEIPF